MGSIVVLRSVFGYWALV